MKLTPWMLTVAIFLIIAALAVGFLFKRLFAKDEAPTVVDTTQVVPMLTSSVEAGTRIQRAHLGRGPADKATLTRDTMLDQDSIVGRIAREDIDSAVPLGGSMFYPIGERPPLELSAGRRGVSVALPDRTARMDDLLNPGSYVDVWMTIDANLPSGTRRQRDSLTLKLFDGVRIIAINGGSRVAGRSDRDGVVTLELDAKQQSIMVAARQKGTITLTANPEGPGAGGLSVEMTETDRITLRQILNISEPEENKPFVTEHIRGRSHSALEFDKDGNRMRGGVNSYGNSNLLGNGVDLNSGWYSSDAGRPSQSGQAGQAGQALSRSQVIGRSN